MRIALRVFATVLIFAILTLLTQVGGIIFLLALLTWPIINRKIATRLARFGTKALSFLLLYSIGIFIVVPVIAKQNGRVQLPMFETNGLKPRTIWTCLLNRNYAKPLLRNTAFSVANKMRDEYPGTVVKYLDSAFPFFDKLPIIPHLSHGDGRKLDVAFHYIDRSSGLPSNEHPSFTGYGVYEAPRASEIDQSEICEKKGFWQPRFLKESAIPNRKGDFIFDSTRTKSLVNYFAADPAIEKIFIEPHLEIRMGLTNPKVRFQGCHAARHDDHVHVQVK